MKKETSEFVDCVVHSSAFRRMQDKTQLYYTFDGDHFHTRLTHSIEVAEIAQEIAERISAWLMHYYRKSNYDNRYVNEHLNGYVAKKISYCYVDPKLTYAIALLHDIGHTPFGHVGERTLSDLLAGKDKDFKFIMDEHLGGFKHNVHSMYLLKNKLDELAKTIIVEDDRKQFIAASWQVLDGVCKHTKVCDPAIKVNDPYCIGAIIVNTPLNELKFDIDTNYTRLNFALSLEGQIVAIADEIAQCVSDYEDMIRANEAELLANRIKNYKKIITKNVKNIKEKIVKGGLNVDNENLLRRELLILNDVCVFLSRLIKRIKSTGHKRQNNISVSIYETAMKECQEMLINDVVDSFICKWLGNRAFYGIKLKNGSVLPNSAVQLEDSEAGYNPIIEFGEKGKMIHKTLKEASKECGIFSFIIRRCDANSEKMVRYLFRSYYNNPTLLPDKTVDSIICNMQNFWKKQNKCKLQDLESAFCVSSIGSKQILKTIKDIQKRFSYFNNNPSISSSMMQVAEHTHEIYAREIAYYIAGMTDSFAMCEYKRLKRIEIIKNN